MVPSIYGENMFDDFFDNSFFGGHNPLFGKHERNLMKTDIRETDDATRILPSCALRRVSGALVAGITRTRRSKVVAVVSMYHSSFPFISSSENVSLTAPSGVMVI